jgi:uncharacterized protein (TIGR03546 family)
MIGPLKKIRKIFKALRSDRTPHEIALGAFFGVFLGLTPAGSHLLLPILAILVFRCAIGMSLFTFAITKGFYFLFGSMAYGLGVKLLHEGTAFDGLVALLHEAPILGLMGFNNYLLFGCYALCIVVGAVLYAGVFGFVVAYRSKFEVWISDKALMEKMRDKKIFKFLSWILMGKDKRKQLDEGEDVDIKPEKRNPLGKVFRLGFALGLPIVLLLVYVGSVFAVNATLATVMEQGIEENLEAPATVTSASLSMFSLGITIEGMSVADPNDHDTSVFDAAVIRLDMDTLALLSGRLHVRNLSADGLQFHVVREEDGSFNLDNFEAAKPDEETESGRKMQEWLETKAAETDWVGLVQRYLEYREEKAAEDAEGDEPIDGPIEEGGEWTFDPDAFEPVAATRPFLWIEKVSASDWTLAVEDRSAEGVVVPQLEKIGGTIENLASDRALITGDLIVKLSIALSGDAGGATIEAAVGHPAQGSPVDFKTDLADLDLLMFKPFFEDSLPVNVLAGTGSLGLAGVVANQQIDAPQTLSLNRLKLEKRDPDQELFGLDAETSGYVIEGINAFCETNALEMTFRVHGAVSSPSFECKADFLEFAKAGLESLGRKELQKHIDRIDGELSKAQAALEEAKDQAQQEIEDAASDAINDALKGDTDSAKDRIDQAKDALKGDDTKDGLKDQLKDLKDGFKAPWKKD